MIGEIEVNGSVYVLKEEYIKVVNLLDSVTDGETDRCSYDHDANCQTHSLHKYPCPYPIARGLIDIYKSDNNSLQT